MGVIGPILDLPSGSFSESSKWIYFELRNETLCELGSFGENPQSGGGGAEEKGGLAKVVQFLNKLGQSLMESHNLERIKKN